MRDGTRTVSEAHREFDLYRVVIFCLFGFFLEALVAAGPAFFNSASSFSSLSDSCNCIQYLVSLKITAG